MSFLELKSYNEELNNLFQAIQQPLDKIHCI